GGRKVGAHANEGKEALPWWFFALLGGVVSVWLLSPLLTGKPGASATGDPVPSGLKASLLTWGINVALFLPGAVAGGGLGLLIIRPVNWALGKFFLGFNRLFDQATEFYGKIVGWCIRLSAIVLLVYVGLLGLTGLSFSRIPSGFVPIQDKGYLLANIQLPDSASLERTVEVSDAVEKIALQTPGVAHTVTIPGQSFVLNANSSNYGSMFVILKAFHERKE